MANISVRFIRDFPYNDEIKEFDIRYNHEEDNHLALIKFIETYGDRRINIELTGSPDIDITLISILYNLNSEIYLKLDSSYISRLDELQEKNIKYYFNLPANNWDSLYSFIHARVSDIYISGELGFNLPKIKEILNLYGIKARAVLNLAQGSDPLNTNSNLKYFFIRPNDIELYQEYIDSFELYDMNQNNRTRILYKIYNHNQNWFGNLQEIITNLDKKIDNRRVLPNFGEFRLNCKKSCYQNSVCNKCNRTQQISETMEDKDLIFTTIYPKENNESK